VGRHAGRQALTKDLRVNLDVLDPSMPHVHRELMAYRDMVEIARRPTIAATPTGSLPAAGHTDSHRRGPARGARLAGRVTARPIAEAKPRRGGGRRREPAHVLAAAAGAVPAPVQARGPWSGGGAPWPQADSQEAGERLPFNAR
jgi:hypothetical protein